MKRRLPLLLAVLAWSLAAFPLWSQTPPPADGGGAAAPPDAAKSARITYLPLAVSGTPGLLYTIGTRTVDPLRVAGGFSYQYLGEAGKPGLVLQTVSAAVAFGFPSGGEISVRVPYIQQTIRESVLIRAPEIVIPKGAVQGLGDIDLGLRWGIVLKQDYLPSFTVGIGGIIPTGQYPEMFGSVKRYGLKFLLVAGYDFNHLPYTNYSFSVYLDGQMIFRDLFQGNDLEEKSGLIDLGFLFPLDANRYTNVLLEYNGAFRQGWTGNLDHHGITAGFRYVNKWFGATVGYTYVIQETKGWNNFHRFGAAVSARMP